MLNTLEVTNRYCYVDGLAINKLLDHLQYEQKGNIKKYTIDNVVFCDISGILTIYKVDDEVRLIFTSFNALSIYNVPNVSDTFDITISKLKHSLLTKYRRLDDFHYFNKRFVLALSYSSNNFSVLITKRSTI